MGCLLGAFIFFSPTTLWCSKTIFTGSENFRKGQQHCNMTHNLRQFSDTTVKMEFPPHYLKVQTLTLLFSAFCQIQGTCSIKMQINVHIQKEHLILKIRHSLLSSSLLQLFIEFTMFIDQKHTTKLLRTAMAYAAALKFSSNHPDAVLLQPATEEYLWKKIYQFSVQIINIPLIEL